MSIRILVALVLRLCCLNRHLDELLILVDRVLNLWVVECKVLRVHRLLWRHNGARFPVWQCLWWDRRHSVGWGNKLRNSPRSTTREFPAPPRMISTYIRYGYIIRDRANDAQHEKTFFRLITSRPKPPRPSPHLRRLPRSLRRVCHYTPRSEESRRAPSRRAAPWKPRQSPSARLAADPAP